MGSGNETNSINGLIDFENHIIIDFREFDYRNMFMCKCLNLRGSSFNSLSSDLLSHLVFIDISFSNIKEVDFRKYYSLI